MSGIGAYHRYRTQCIEDVHGHSTRFNGFQQTDHSSKQTNRGLFLYISKFRIQFFSPHLYRIIVTNLILKIICGKIQRWLMPILLSRKPSRSQNVTENLIQFMNQLTALARTQMTVVICNNMMVKLQFPKLYFLLHTHTKGGNLCGI